MHTFMSIFFQFYQYLSLKIHEPYFSKILLSVRHCFQKEVFNLNFDLGDQNNKLYPTNHYLLKKGLFYGQLINFLKYYLQFHFL
jgi:hypothetical protein